MWVTVHTLSGLALGTAVPIHSALLVPFALLLHLTLDLVPHFDYTGLNRRTWWAVLDVGAAVAFVGVLAITTGVSDEALLAAAVSAAPDLDVFDSLLSRRRRVRIFPSHWRRFPHGRTGPRRGMLVQVLVIGLSLVLYYVTTA